MSLKAKLKGELRTFFNVHRNIPHYTKPKSSGNIFELYVYAQILDEIISLQNARIVLISNKFVFRCSPGQIDDSKYSHVHFVKGTNRYVLRNGIEFRGHSLMYHEFDITLTEESTPLQGRPGHQALIWGFECKCYASLKQLKGEVRKYLGAVTDCTQMHHQLISGRQGASVGCIHCGIGFQPGFLTNTDLAQRPDMFNYLESYGLHPHTLIHPNSTNLGLLAGRIRQLINALP